MTISEDDKRKYKLAATAVACGIVGNRVTSAIMDQIEPEVDFMPPPIKAPKEPGKKNEDLKYHEEDGPKLRIKTPLDRIDEVRLVQCNTQKGPTL